MNLGPHDFHPFRWGFSIESKGEGVSLINQVHGTHIVELKQKPDHHLSEALLGNADGIMTHLENTPISVVSADCIPLLFFSEDASEPIVAIHAGWRGVKLGIIEKAVRLFKTLEELHVVIGPSIGSCCFKVREDFLSDWKQAGIETSPFLIQESSLVRFDLLTYVLSKTLKGIFPSHIHLESHRCTVCSVPPLPSFRRNKTANPRIRSWILKQSEIAIS